MADLICSHCGKPVVQVEGLLWICTAACYLDWFHRLFLPRVA